MDSNSTKEIDNIQEEKSKKQKKAPRSFPTIVFEDTLVVAKVIQEYASGHKIRRLTLFDYLGKSPDSGPSKQLLRECAKYELITGGPATEYIELTQDGFRVSSTDAAKIDQIKAKFKLAILTIDPFRSLYEQYKNNKLPTRSILSDFLKEQGMNESWIEECINFFIINAKYVGLLRLMSGAERLLSVEHLIEEAGGEEKEISTKSVVSIVTPPSNTPSSKGKDKAAWEHVCFYIAPIGEDGSEHRQHSDLFLNHIVEPSVAEFNLS